MDKKEKKWRFYGEMRREKRKVTCIEKISKKKKLTIDSMKINSWKGHELKNIFLRIAGFYI